MYAEANRWSAGDWLGIYGVHASHPTKTDQKGGHSVELGFFYFVGSGAFWLGSTEDTGRRFPVYTARLHRAGCVARVQAER